MDANEYLWSTTSLTLLLVSNLGTWSCHKHFSSLDLWTELLLPSCFLSVVLLHNKLQPILIIQGSYVL